MEKQNIRDFVDELYILIGETIRDVGLSNGQHARLRALGMDIPRSGYIKVWSAIKFLEGLEDGSDNSSIIRGRTKN